jgi:hypothetical protein
MNNGKQTVSIVHKWLSLMSISVEKKYIRQRLLSHPEYPSALCITSLLDDLGIENGVAQIDEAQLSEIPTPFLAFIDHEEFSLVTDLEKIENSIKDFRIRWNGVVIYAEKPTEIIQAAELKKINDSESNFTVKWAIAITVIAVLSSVAFLQSSAVNAILCLLNFLGLVVCGSIVLRELGIESVVSQQLCGKGDNTGCDAVLHSTISKLPLGIKLSDVGVFFFSGVTLLLLMNSMLSENYQKISHVFIAGITLASIPFTFFSVYYQWKVAKQWCKSCLLVVAILWAMAVAQIPYPFALISVNLITVTGVVSFFALPGLLWLLIRAHLNQAQELTNSNFLLQRIYRSPELLESHLTRQSKIDTTPWEHDYQIGNRDAPCQIVVVSSHFCGPCSETHALLRELITKHRDKVGITVRYMVNSNDKNGRKTKIARHMLQYALTTEAFLNDPHQVEQLFSSWYQLMDIEKFKLRYPVREEKMDVDDLLEQQLKWCIRSEIYYTPSVIINGYKLESPYSHTDLPEISGNLIDMFSRVESNSEAVA